MRNWRQPKSVGKTTHYKGRRNLPPGWELVAPGLWRNQAGASVENIGGGSNLYRAKRKGGEVAMRKRVGDAMQWAEGGTNGEQAEQEEGADTDGPAVPEIQGGQVS